MLSPKDDLDSLLHLFIKAGVCQVCGGWYHPSIEFDEKRPKEEEDLINMAGITYVVSFVFGSCNNADQISILWDWIVSGSWITDHTTVKAGRAVFKAYQQHPNTVPQ